MDGSGRSLAVWDERTTKDQLWSRSKPNGGGWGRAMQVSGGERNGGLERAGCRLTIRQHFYIARSRGGEFGRRRDGH